MGRAGGESRVVVGWLLTVVIVNRANARKERTEFPRMRIYTYVCEGVNERVS